MSAPPVFETLSDAVYQERSAATLAAIERTVDAWLDADMIDIDATRTGGMLELAFPNGSRIIVNTQPPLHELWLAALSGGFHFKPADGRWADTRDGRDFFVALSECASEQGQAALRFEG